MKHFIKGEYKGRFEGKLLSEFEQVLLTTPPWEKSGYNHNSTYKEKQEIRKALYKKFNPEGRLLIL